MLLPDQALREALMCDSPACPPVTLARCWLSFFPCLTGGSWGSESLSNLLVVTQQHDRF